MQIMMSFEHGENPEDTKATGSQQGYHHGQERIPDSSHTPHADIHNTAQEVGSSYHFQTVDAIPNHFRLVGVNPK